MYHRREVFWVIAAVGALGLSFTVSRFIVRAQPHTTPFTLKRELHSTLPNAPDTAHRWETLAMRSDGAMAHVTVFGGKQQIAAGEAHRAVVFADGRNISFYPSIRAKTTWQPDAAGAARRIAGMLNPPQHCVTAGSRLVGSDTLGGQQVDIVEVTFDADASATFWAAPKFGCLQFQSKGYLREPDGTMVLASEDRFVSLEFGEPDPALFDLPDGYQQMKPSEVQRRRDEKYGLGSLRDDQVKYFEDLDYAYVHGTLRPNGRYWREALPTPPGSH